MFSVGYGFKKDSPVKKERSAKAGMIEKTGKR